MQKKTYLFILVGFALFVATFLIAITASGGLFPIQAESRVAIVFNDDIDGNNFVKATEGAQKILNTMVNIADFAEVKNKVFNSGFAVTENIFNGSTKENMSTWKRYVRIKPIDNSFVLKITTGGSDYAEAEELAAVIAHEVSLEVPVLFTNLRGISDQPKLVNHRLEIFFIYFFAVVIIAICLFILWNRSDKNSKVGLSKVENSDETTILTDEKLDRNPRYFLQKFLEEHQKTK
jgi:hypothetical protein